MREEFLQYIWQQQLFEHHHLCTCDGKVIKIVHQGHLNSNAGPDFLMAQIIIEDIVWHGNVEVHYKSSDWLKHQHQKDKAYDNVILHVVWKNDVDIYNLHHQLIPALELKNRVSISLIQRFDDLLKSRNKIPCESSFPKVPELVKRTMYDKVMAERLELKSNEIKTLLLKNNFDWEETTYQLLAKNFGFKTNSEAMISLSQKLPLKIIQKHRPNIFQIESLLMGQAGLLDDYFTDEYPTSLKNEYNFLAKKHQLLQHKMTGKEWKFAKMRPANFPTIRMAELASIFGHHPQLFSQLLEAEDFKTLENIFTLPISSYWNSHYVFDKLSPLTKKNIGKTSIHNIIANTVIPLLVCYAKEKSSEQWMEKALQFLEALPKETNHITNIFESLGENFKSTFDSQAIIGLYNHYCKTKSCIKCNIGNYILNKQEAETSPIS